MSIPSIQPQANVSQSGPQNSTHSQFEIIDSIPTFSITQNSAISQKVKQCLDVLISKQLPSRDQNQKDNISKVDNGKFEKGIIAIKAVHPNTGSKAITIAEIVKRRIGENGDTEEDKAKKSTIWFQYTKVESKLIEWPPPQKPTKKGKDSKKSSKVSTSSKDKKSVAGDTNPNKRKPLADNSSNQPTKKLKTSHESIPTKSMDNGRSEASIDDPSIPKPTKSHPVHLSSPDIPFIDIDDDDEIPPHLRGDSGKTPRKPLNKQTSSENMKDDARKEVIEILSDDDDEIPPFLRDNMSPLSEFSDDIPPHLRPSTPTTPMRDSKKIEPKEQVGDKSEAEKIEIDDESDSHSDISSEEIDEDEDEDDFGEFSFIKNTVKNKHIIDMEEKNRKKYRAIPIMTIIISLSRKEELKKLFGEQTNESSGKIKISGKD